jgi:hypothetical protein
MIRYLTFTIALAATAGAQELNNAFNAAAFSGRSDSGGLACPASLRRTADMFRMRQTNSQAISLHDATGPPDGADANTKTNAESLPGLLAMQKRATTQAAQHEEAQRVARYRDVRLPNGEIATAEYLSHVCAVPGGGHPLCEQEEGDESLRGLRAATTPTNQVSVLPTTNVREVPVAKSQRLDQLRGVASGVGTPCYDTPRQVDARGCARSGDSVHESVAFPTTYLITRWDDPSPYRAGYLRAGIVPIPGYISHYDAAFYDSRFWSPCLVTTLLPWSYIDTLPRIGADGATMRAILFGEYRNGPDKPMSRQISSALIFEREGMSVEVVIPWNDCGTKPEFLQPLWVAEWR